MVIASRRLSFGAKILSVSSGCICTGKHLVTGSEDGTMFVWNPKTGKPKHHLKGHGFHEGPVTCVATHPDPAQPILISGMHRLAIFLFFIFFFLQPDDLVQVVVCVLIAACVQVPLTTTRKSFILRRVKCSGL